MFFSEASVAMAPGCRDDPVVCIDAVAVFIGEFLKDGTTMAMLAALFVLLLRLRADQKKAKSAEYARQMLKLETRRSGEGVRSTTWEAKGGK